MSRVIFDLTGHKYGRLTVIGYAGKDSSNKLLWFCRCDCGNYVKVRGNSLRTGNTTSCGCYHGEVCARINKERSLHNMSHTRIFQIWLGMLDRCYNPKNPAYKNYGGRGIRVCDEWHEFLNFYKDMAETYQDNLTLDRIDTNGNYEKGNCRWATPRVQANNRRNNIKISINGTTDTLSNLCRKYGVKYETGKWRYKQGWNPEKILTPPKSNCCSFFM